MVFRIFRLFGVIATGLFLLVGCTTSGVVETPEGTYAESLRGAVFDPPRPIEDFTLASTTGTQFSFSDHHGEVILIYFGYRSCPDFCPTTFAELRRVYSELEEPADKLKIMFVTIDPERDTLDYLGQYIGAFHEDFIGLRAEGQTLRELEASFGVVAEKRVVGESELSYLFDHTASVFLIGPNGELEAQYLYGTNYRDIVHDLRLIFETL